MIVFYNKDNVNKNADDVSVILINENIKYKLDSYVIYDNSIFRKCWFLLLIDVQNII